MIVMPIKEPTLFIHGYSGTYFSFNRMLKKLTKNHLGKRTCLIIVTRSGNLYFLGHPDSLIQVIFLENRANVHLQVKWIWKLLNCLKYNYGILQVNLVAHSMGCVSVLMYLSQYGYDHRNSQVKRVVTIGAPFNDSEVGKRTDTIENHFLTNKGPIEMAPLYRWMRIHHLGIPIETQFLNIAGNLQNGTFSDGQVSVNSALSLRYLMKNIQFQYEEHVIYGKKAAHSQLHDNDQVSSLIIDFLLN